MSERERLDGLLTTIIYELRAEVRDLKSHWSDEAVVAKSMTDLAEKRRVDSESFSVNIASALGLRETEWATNGQLIRAVTSQTTLITNILQDLAERAGIAVGDIGEAADLIEAACNNR